jgi:hypothetical protein
MEDAPSFSLIDPPLNLRPHEDRFLNLSASYDMLEVPGLYNTICPLIISGLLRSILVLVILQFFKNLLLDNTEFSMLILFLKAVAPFSLSKLIGSKQICLASTSLVFSPSLLFLLWV